MMKARFILSVVALAGMGATLVPDSAKAWVSFGFAVPPVVVAPPVPYGYPYPYYPPPPPPAYYPPAAYGAPPAPQSMPPEGSGSQYSQAQGPYGTMCYAGNYTCAAAPYSPVGSGCSCPGLGAPSFGSVQ